MFTEKLEVNFTEAELEVVNICTNTYKNTFANSFSKENLPMILSISFIWA